MEEYCYEEIPALLTYWFWVKMVSPNAEKRIEFHLSVDGEDATEWIENPEVDIGIISLRKTNVPNKCRLEMKCVALACFTQTVRRARLMEKRER